MITVVSDTSPLVALAFLGLEPLIPQLFGTTYIGPLVAAELASPRYGFSGTAADKLPGVVIRQVVDVSLITRFASQVDLGEAESLALAAEMKADLVIVDDDEARQLAMSLGFKITGTVGLLLEAKSAGHIHLIKPLLDRLRSDLRFFLFRKLYERALAAAGE